MSTMFLPKNNPVQLKLLSMCSPGEYTHVEKKDQDEPMEMLKHAGKEKVYKKGMQT